jgi:pimeloyl-ACP methyl ester carboxylesterase
MTYTHETAPTQFVKANGIRFAYRRFGKAGGIPVVFNQHFQGTLDHWDPAVTEGLAATREVILFDNAGVSSSSGETPDSFQAMGANAIAFIKALGTYDPAEHLWLKVHFSPSAESQAAGLAFLERKLRRQELDPLVGEQTVAAQIAAIGKYMAYRGSDGYLDYLKDIRQPTLVVQGSNDVIIPTENSYVLQQTLPNAQLILYPDANHGSFYQYPDLFVARPICSSTAERRPATSTNISKPGAARTASANPLLRPKFNPT